MDDEVVKKDSYGKYSYNSTPVPPGNSGDSGDSTQGTVPKVPTVPTPCRDCQNNYECSTCEHGSNPEVKTKNSLTKSTCKY
jgi:hypothetical protein